MNISIPGAELEANPCPMGCSAGDDFILAGRDRLHNLPGEFRVVRCRECGLMRTNPRPTPESMEAYYPSDYGPYVSTRVGAGGRSYLARPRWVRLARRMVELNDERLPELSPGRLLEIGCASGSFLHRMASLGWEVEGLEFSAEAANAARSLGYPIHSGALEAASSPSGAFDLVVGWMVFEHLRDPVGALRKLRRWTKPGGRLAGSVPDAASLEFRVFGERWLDLDVPRHLFHFTPSSLSKVLEKTGWRLERIFRQRVLSPVVASLGNLVEDRHWAPRLAKRLKDFPESGGLAAKAVLYPIAWLLSLVGLTGRMTFWARTSD